MKLTSEQAQVLNYVKSETLPQNIALIALAGAGKTSTLKAIAEASQDRKILYLVFSKAMQRESEKKFPKNVTVKTVNGLAYQALGIQAEPLSKYDRYTVAKALKCDTESAKIVIEELNGFLNSDLTKMNYEYSDLAKEFWQKICNREVNFTHQAYMKYFSIYFDNFKEKLDYDLLLVDESQDLDPIALQITQNFKMPRVFVGDPNQSIFGFNGNVNVFDVLEFSKKMQLTQTFRCSQNIVDWANQVLEYKSAGIAMQTKVKQKLPENKAIIARTNAKIIQILYSYLKNCDLNDLSNIRIPKLSRSIKELFAGPETIQNLINFAKDSDNEPQILDQNFAWLKKMIVERQMNDKEFRAFCMSSENPDVRQAYLLLIRSYNEDFSLKQLKYALLELQKHHQVMPNVWLLTAHSSKGLEFDSVVLCDDFPNLHELKAKFQEAFAHANFGKNIEVQESARLSLAEKEQNFLTEANLLYVAGTRAIDEMEDLSENRGIFFYINEQVANTVREENSQSLKP